MTAADSRSLGDDALRKRVDALGDAGRRAEAAQALRACTWLEALRLRLDLAIEIIGTDLAYVFDPLPELHVSAGLRSALQSVDESERGQVLTGVLRSGRARALVAGDFNVRLVPFFVRTAVSPVPMGVLAISDPQADRRRSGGAEAAEAVGKRLEIAGQWLVAAIEASLAATVKQIDESRDLERTAGSFDVVDALTRLNSEREIIALLMDAVALWYDADVYVYRQDLSGAFVLHAALPGANAERAAPQLPGHQIWGRGEVFSAESHRELEEFGWSASIGHTLFLPISVEESTEWLLAVAEAGDTPRIRQTLDVFGRVASTLLADLQHQAMARLLRKLTSILLFGDAPVHATARMAFEAVAAETGASSVQFAVFDFHEPGPPHQMVSLRWGAEDTEPVPFVDAEATSLSSRAIAVGVGAGSSVTAVLSVRRDAGAFAPAAQRLVRLAASTIGVWLSGSLGEPRDLGAPAAPGYSTDLAQRMRSQVDRFGHVKVAGAVAVVLPQAQVPEEHAIDEAVELIEHHVRPTDVIGAVGPTAAGVLLPEATRDVASAVVGRLLRAAREKGLMAVRVGVAMFAASSESPESVLERALMNARRGSAG